MGSSVEDDVKHFAGLILNGDYGGAAEYARKNQSSFRDLDETYKEHLNDVITNRTKLSSLDTNVFYNPEKAAQESVQHLEDERPDKFFTLYYQAARLYHVLDAANLNEEAKALRFDLAEMNEMIEDVLINELQDNPKYSGMMVTGLVATEDKLRDEGYEFPTTDLEQVREEWIQSVQNAQEELEQKAEKEFERAERVINQTDLISIEDGGNPNIESHMSAENTNTEISLIENLSEGKDLLEDSQKKFEQVMLLERILGQAETDHEDGSISEAMEQRVSEKEELAERVLEESEEEAQLEHESEERLREIKKLKQKINEKVKEYKNQ